MRPSTENPIAVFAQRQGIVVLDGGLATALEVRGYELDDDLWSAKILLEAPDAIRQVHLDFLAAGADCIATSTYQASLPGFRKRGLSDGTHLSDGSRLVDAARDCDAEPRVAAVGINCTSPEFISPLITEVRKGTGKPVIVYPNSGERYDSEHRIWVGSLPQFGWEEASIEWVRLGATGIGGCCRVGPQEIARMRRQLVT